MIYILLIWLMIIALILLFLHGADYDDKDE